jgi:hypothetical protein
MYFVVAETGFIDISVIITYFICQKYPTSTTTKMIHAVVWLAYGTPILIKSRDKIRDELITWHILPVLKRVHVWACLI